jgi:hypothetical protein
MFEESRNMLDSQWYDRAKAIRQTIVQLRDSL